MITKECIHCGEIFKVSPSLAKRRFCSRACVSGYKSVELTCEHCGKSFSRAQSRQYCKHNYCSFECSSLAKRIPVKVNCFVCGKELERRPSQIGRKHFCGEVCRATTKSRVVSCEHCGKEVERTPAQLKRRKNVYCSKECGYSSIRRRSLINSEGEKPWWMRTGKTIHLVSRGGE